MTDINKELHEWLKSPAPESTVIIVDKENRLLDIYLEDVASYNEWIKGEWTDVCLHRATTDNRVVGVTLPLRNTNISFDFREDFSI